jgi:DNA-binding NtrC family response regulator
MKPYSLYIIDDEQMVREGFSLAIKPFYQIQTFESAEEALKIIKKEPPDLVLLDIGLRTMNGIEALERIKAINNKILVIMVTAYEDVETVVAAMKLGAYDYTVKPVHIETLLNTIRNALDTIKMRKEIQSLQDKYLRENQPWFVSESDSIQHIMETVQKVARGVNTSVLIQGETGTGKELIAKAIHYRSPLFNKPFIAVNCAAFPSGLIESELFGYEKGAFTGANPGGKTGLIEEAENGTLFLDEVGDLNLESQAKILRFLETGEYYKVGSAKKRQARVRIISATNKDLGQMVREGHFRDDLFYRLAVINLSIPPLNRRPDDIIPIAKYFLLEFSKKFGKTFESISPNAEKVLKKHHWKGNVRELKNIIERSTLIADGPVLKVCDMALESIFQGLNQQEESHDTIFIPESGIDLPTKLQSIEKQFFKEAFQIANRNESKAARLLNLSRDKFRYRRKKLNLD